MERWGAWPGQVSRDGTASSSAPGSGCAGTLGLWTRGSLCLCSERSRGTGKRGEGERCYWKCYRLPYEHPQRPNSPTQSSERTRTLETTLGGATSISPSILPSLSAGREEPGCLLLLRAGSLTPPNPQAMACVFLDQSST